jgi:hypothetical protein
MWTDVLLLLDSNLTTTSRLFKVRAGCCLDLQMRAEWS